MPFGIRVGSVPHEPYKPAYDRTMDGSDATRAAPVRFRSL
jgi:hypothetical protein